MNSLDQAALLSRLISSSSISSPDQSVDEDNREVIACLAEFAEHAGFSVELQELAGGKQNLIARKGSGTKGLVLSGHSDTVPFNRERWDSDPLELSRRDGKLFGRGTADMKGFFAAALAAAMRFDEHTLKRPLMLVATADEESTMDGARALDKSMFESCSVAVIGEPTGLVPVSAHKGILMEEVVLRGKSGHSSNPALGVSALDGMRHVLSALGELRSEFEATRDKRFEVPHATLNLGRIVGGDSPNRICSECTLSFDVRMLPGTNVEQLRALLRERLMNSGFDERLEFELYSLAEAIGAFSTADAGRGIDALTARTGQKPISVMFCTEAPFFSALGLETIVCGGGDIAVAHQPNEFITESALHASTELYAGLIHDLCVA